MSMDKTNDTTCNVKQLLAILDSKPDNDTGLVTGSAATTYMESNEDKRVLFAMCIGLVDPTGDALVNVEHPPWSTIKKRREVIPNQKTLVAEMKRRLLVDCKEGPRAANWTMAKITDWLVQNPIKSTVDTNFIAQEVSKFRSVIEAVEQSTVVAMDKQWRGSVPYLRMIMSLTEDDIKQQYILHGTKKTRAELDARNSDVREKTVYELIADRWNDENFNPVVPSFMVHEDFRCPTDCAFEFVKEMTPATGEKVRDVISHMRANLNRIISNWEQSGQGDSGHLPDNGEANQHGNLQNRSAAALDSRASFLGAGHPSYLLVLWEIADTHQILQHTLQRLSVGVCASDASLPPSVIKCPRRLSNSPPITDQSIGSMLHETMDNFADKMANVQRDNHSFQEKTRINARISHLTDLVRATKKEKFRSKNEEEKSFLQEEIVSIETEIESLNATLREFNRSESLN